MFPKMMFIVFLFLSSGNPSSPFLEKPAFTDREYVREFYPSGKINSEGWTNDGMKLSRCKFYYPNGKLFEEEQYEKGHREKFCYFYTEQRLPKEQGDYINGMMTDWWFFFDSNGKINHTFHLKSGQKNGYCLKYQNKEPTFAKNIKTAKRLTSGIVLVVSGEKLTFRN